MLVLMSFLIIVIFVPIVVLIIVDAGVVAISRTAIAQITFTTNIPSGVDPCLPGGSSWVWSLDYRTGGPIASSTTTYPAARSLGLALASRPVLVKLPTGKVKIEVNQTYALKDAAQALQFVRSKAAEWNIDKARIGASGGSAGACPDAVRSWADQPL